MTSTQPNRAERGNAFLFILIGIVLFAGLAYTISRGMRTQTTTSMTGQQVSMAASDLISYGQSLERGISRLRRKGISENDISFEAPGVAANGNCGDDTCKLFHVSGGGVSWQNLAASLTLAPSADRRWQFSGRHEFPGIGTDGGATTNSDLVAFVEGIPRELCARINSNITDSEDIPVLSGGATMNTGAGEPFAGTYGTDVLTVGSGPAIDGRSTFCIQNGAAQEYIFYNILVAR